MPRLSRYSRKIPTCRTQGTAMGLLYRKSPVQCNVDPVCCHVPLFACDHTRFDKLMWGSPALQTLASLRTTDVFAFTSISEPWQGDGWYQHYKYSGLESNDLWKYDPGEIKAQIGLSTYTRIGIICNEISLVQSKPQFLYTESSLCLSSKPIFDVLILEFMNIRFNFSRWLQPLTPRAAFILWN